LLAPRRRCRGRAVMADWYAEQTIGSLPERAARHWGAREALAFQGRRWSFAEVDARVDALAKGLLELGIGPGDKVALWMVNRPEWVDAMFAVMKIGAVLVPMNTRFRTEDMAYVLAQSDASVVLLAERSGPVDYLGMMREVAPALSARGPTRASPACATWWCSRSRPRPAPPAGARCSSAAPRWRPSGCASGRPASIPTTSRSCSTPPAPPGFPRGRCTATGWCGTRGTTATAWA